MEEKAEAELRRAFQARGQRQAMLTKARGPSGKIIQEVKPRSRLALLLTNNLAMYSLRHVLRHGTISLCRSSSRRCCACCMLLPHSCLLPGSALHGQEATFLSVGD
jgi:hypothetical protein